MEMSKVSVFHADHGVSQELISWALDQIQPTGFFLRTLLIPESFGELQNGLYGPSAGDESVGEDEVEYIKRSEDRPPSRLVNRPTRPTRLLTIIGLAKEDGTILVFTAYGGPAAEREVGDASLKDDPAAEAAAIEFWKHHALVKG